MNRDELKGTTGALKGRIKQAAGTLTRDRARRGEGVIDEVAGRIQAIVGRSKRKAGDAIEDVSKVAYRVGKVIKR